MKNYLLLFSIFCIFSCFNLEVSAQTYNLSTPLEPSANEGSGYTIGAYLGLGQNIQSGEFYVDCDDCIFKDGVGFRWNVGLLYEYEFMTQFQLGLMTGLMGGSINSAFNEIEALEYQLGGQTNYINMMFNHNSSLSFMDLEIAPYVKYTLADLFFIRAGAAIYLPLSAELTHDKEAQATRVTLADGSTAIMRFEKTRLQENKIENQTSPRLMLMTAVGMNLHLSDRVFISPVFDYRLPLNDYGIEGNGFGFASWQLMLELKIRTFNPPRLYAPVE